MADYQKMYSLLFNEMSKAIEILQSAQAATEEMFVASPPIVLRLAKEDDESES